MAPDQKDRKASLQLTATAHASHDHRPALYRRASAAILCDGRGRRLFCDVPAGGADCHRVFQDRARPAFADRRSLRGACGLCITFADLRAYTR